MYVMIAVRTKMYVKCMADVWQTSAADSSVLLNGELYAAGWHTNRRKWMEVANCSRKRFEWRHMSDCLSTCRWSRRRLTSSPTKNDYQSVSDWLQHDVDPNCCYVCACQCVSFTAELTSSFQISSFFFQI